MNVTTQDITEVITSTIRAVNMDLKLKQERTGVNMMYDFIKNEVLVDCERVQAACMELPEPMSLKTYVEILTIHELGHAMDREALHASLDRTIEIYEAKKLVAAEKRAIDLPYLTMLLEEHEADIVFEQTAWANAEILNRFFQVADWHCFETVKAHSLSTYEASLETDRMLFNKLLGESGISNIKTFV